MLQRVPRWTLVATLALVPTIALAAATASEGSGLCGSLCAMLLGCGG